MITLRGSLIWPRVDPTCHGASVLVKNPDLPLLISSSVRSGQRSQRMLMRIITKIVADPIDLDFMRTCLEVIFSTEQRPFLIVVASSHQSPIRSKLLIDRVRCRSFRCGPSASCNWCVWSTFRYTCPRLAERSNAGASRSSYISIEVGHRSEVLSVARICSKRFCNAFPKLIGSRLLHLPVLEL